MKVLFAASEATPIVKIGGLGDVAGALPKALEGIGIDVDVIIPFYHLIDQGKFRIVKQLSITVPFANATHEVGVYKTRLPGSSVDVLLLRNEKYLGAGGSDAFSSLKDEIERFAFFDRAVVEYVKAKFNIYDIVHCNDWHTGIVTHLLEEEVGEERPATLFTIHNVSYQGEWGLDLVQEIGLSVPSHKILQWDLEDGNINFMLEGIASSDFVSTVSPTYAKELLFPDIGGGMAEVLRGKKGRFTGILNGIDYVYFNPATDSMIRYKFNHMNAVHAKGQNKTLLQRELGLDMKDVPVLSLVSRLDTKQKGLDLLSGVIKELLEMEIQLIILGKGDKEYEKALIGLSKLKKYHGKLSVNIGFDEALARRIYAGSEIFLMPSKTEPCGLSQLISMRYGTLPIVHAVGGLKDTVKDGETGFSFSVYSAPAFLKTIKKAVKLWKSRKWETMLQKAMKKDFSWKNSAMDYAELYERMVKARKG